MRVLNEKHGIHSVRSELFDSCLLYIFFLKDGYGAYYMNQSITWLMNLSKTGQIVLTYLIQASEVIYVLWLSSNFVNVQDLYLQDKIAENMYSLQLLEVSYNKMSGVVE